MRAHFSYQNCLKCEDIFSAKTFNEEAFSPPKHCQLSSRRIFICGWREFSWPKLDRWTSAEGCAAKSRVPDLMDICGSGSTTLCLLLGEENSFGQSWTDGLGCEHGEFPMPDIKLRVFAGYPVLSFVYFLGEENSVGQSWTGGLAQGCAPVFQPFGEPGTRFREMTSSRTKLRHLARIFVYTLNCSTDKDYTVPVMEQNIVCKEI
jgi:hypothetical protein